MRSLDKFDSITPLGTIGPWWNFTARLSMVGSVPLERPDLVVL